jgi:zinc protease
MIRNLFAAIAVAVLLHAAPMAAAQDTDAGASAQPARLFDLPHLQRELDNGLRVIVVQTPQKGLVSIQIPMQTGSRNEVEPGKSGFAHFFEHMMFRGTPKHPADAYGAALKAAGADQNAYTDDDLTNYYVNITPADLDRLLELEADRFQNLAYSEEQFRTEAQAVKGEYLKNYSNPLLKGYERLQGLAFTTHTYGHTTMGYLKDIEDMPNQMAYSKTFFDRWYRPEYATVIVAGDVELEPTFELVRKHFGGWKRGSYTQQIPAEPAQDAPRYAHVAFDGPTQPWLLVGWKAPAFTTEGPDSAAQALLAEVHFGSTSPLYQRLVVRERLVDQLLAQPSRSRDPGLFVLALRLTDAAHAPKVVAAIDETLLAARSQLLDADQLAQTRSRLKYAFAGGMDNAARIGAILAGFVHYERDLETLNRYYAALDALDAEAVRATANRVFADAHRNAVSIAQAPALDGADGFRALDAAAIAARADAPPTPDAPAAAPPAAKPLTPINARIAASTRTFEIDTMRISAPIIEQRNQSPLVDVALVFRTGAAVDPAGKKGLAALTAQLMAQGSSTELGYEQIQKATYPLAASLNVQFDKDMVRFFGTVHRDNAAAWWRIVGPQVHSPAFRDDDFQRVREQQISAIRTTLRANNDEELAKELLYQQVYGPGHPYGTLSLGKVSDLQKITLADVRDFYRTRFTRGQLVVGLAGGYDDQFAGDVLASLARLSRAGEPPRKPVAAPKANERSALVVRKQTPAVAVSFGVPIGVIRGHDDWVALWLARSWLGEHRSQAGRLFERIREVRGMNYGSYAYIEYFPNGMFRMQPEPNYLRDSDLFQIWIRPLRDNNDAVFATRVALFEVDKLVSKGMSEADFTRTRDFLRKFVSNLTSTQTAQLGYAIDSLVAGTDDFPTYVGKGLDALDVEKVNAALRRHVDLRGAKFVYISAEGDDLAKRLTSSAPTPIKYNSEKPAELLAEDKVIQALPLGLGKRVEIVDDKIVFE